jgi:integrase
MLTRVQSGVCFGSFASAAFDLKFGDWGQTQGFFTRQSLRRTKATLSYRRSGKLRAVQLLLGHTNIESTARYLGIEVDDAWQRQNN